MKKTLGLGGENDLRCARPSFVCEAALGEGREREDERHTVLGDRKAPSSAGCVSEQSFSSHEPRPTPATLFGFFVRSEDVFLDENFFGALYCTVFF